MRTRSVLLALVIAACDRGGEPITPLVADGGARPTGASAPEPAAAASHTPTPTPSPRPVQASAPPPKQSPSEALAAAPESPPRAAAPLPIREEARVKLQPERAHTSGNLVEGTVSSVAFLGPQSELLVGGGNDDRVHVAEIASGRERWASPKLGKDVEAVAACGEHFAGLTYEGRLEVYRRAPSGKIEREPGRRGGGSKWLAFTEDCEHLLTPEFLGQLFIYERRSGALAAELPADGYRNFGYAGGRTVYRTRVPLPAQPGPKPPSGGTVDLVPADPPPFEERYFLYDWHAAGSPARGTTTPLPYAHEDDALGWLTQVKPTPWGGLIREYCDRRRCRVILEDRQRIVDFAVAGGVWTLALGSALELSADGAYLAWYRDGLPVEIVELRSGRRVQLPKVRRTMSSTVEFAFDPRDPARLAVTMHPAPNMVTVYRLGDGA
ncbi:MAG: hypothetical protein KC420_14190 [Myxococcales bacterium]|nr:hypothetical protein [Myxococcales bacterium]